MGAAVNAIIRVMGQLMGIVIFETVFSEYYALPSAADYASTASPEALAFMAAAFSLVFWLAAAIAIVTLSPCHLPGRSAAGSRACLVQQDSGFPQRPFCDSLCLRADIGVRNGQATST
jgi:hypothetical protein